LLGLLGSRCGGTGIMKGLGDGSSGSIGGNAGWREPEKR
jgi:hypothetical protein